ncbi:hypothetical protein [Actinomadura xylanilytica]|uniref:hypothetical protein n=1 Tax=Actinomadura xylanilytica TaxID=887459 RepID=UPI00255AA5A0|nr:hypothetical protein [Actinomadura xylanilytica]MDL4773164.1 hypothetical protein [Actinomadura xylanilytica]
MIIEYYIAKDDAEAACVEPGMGGPERQGFDTLSAKSIDPCVALGTLESILTGRSFDEILADPRQCGSLDDSEEMGVVEASAVTVTDTLRDALASANVPRLQDVAKVWADTDELSGVVTPEVLGDFLKMFSDFAHGAVEKGERLYCWWTL